MKHAIEILVVRAEELDRELELHEEQIPGLQAHLKSMQEARAMAVAKKEQLVAAIRRLGATYPPVYVEAPGDEDAED